MNDTDKLITREYSKRQLRALAYKYMLERINGMIPDGVQDEYGLTDEQLGEFIGLCFKDVCSMLEQKLSRIASYIPEPLSPEEQHHNMEVYDKRYLRELGYEDE